MDLPNFNTSMSHVIPPIISDTPPPLDVLVDENDDDDGFGDFRVASDLGFDLSDNTAEAEEWVAPAKPILPLNEICHNSVTKIVERENDIPSSISDKREDITFGENRLDDVISEENELVNEIECDPPDITEELNRISVSPVLSSCDVDLDVRTSPEGADDDNNCVSENKLCELENPSISNSRELDIESVDPVVFSKSVEEDSSDDAFTDFADFSTQPLHVDSEIDAKSSSSQGNQVVAAETPDDDFDDFDDFESAAPLSNVVTENSSKVEDVDSTLTTIFGSAGGVDLGESNVDPRLTECLHACLDDSSSVWGHLKDLETSFALSLQWSGSSASKRLLSSLSVDSRNILIGQRWNPSMPRFASNIGCAPLEPMKAASDDESPAVNETTSNAPLPVPEGVVPAAQFDWNGSGLINPLDCMEKEEAALAGNPTELILEKRREVPNPVESPLTDLWTKTDTPTSDILSPTVADTSPLSPIQSAVCTDQTTWSKMDILVSTPKGSPTTVLSPSTDKTDEPLALWSTTPEANILKPKDSILACENNTNMLVPTPKDVLSLSSDQPVEAHALWSNTPVANILTPNESTLASENEININMIVPTASSSHAFWNNTTEAKATTLASDANTPVFEIAKDTLSETFWSKTDLPVTDILLPTPNDALSSFAEPITRNSLASDPTVFNSVENGDWVQPVSIQTMPTISSNLENINFDIIANDGNVKETPKKMSSEACRVVEALPDLSFLSARKLLYTANANMARFQASARP